MINPLNAVCEGPSPASREQDFDRVSLSRSENDALCKGFALEATHVGTHNLDRERGSIVGVRGTEG